MFEFRWKIENYSLCNKKKGTFILSPTFTVESGVGNSKWYLKLSPGGDDDCDIEDEYLSLSLYRSSNCAFTEKISFFFDISIILANGETIAGFENVEAKRILKGSGLGWSEFLEIAKLSSAMKKLPEDALTICFKIKVDHPAFEKRTRAATTKIGMNGWSFRWDLKLSFDFPNWQTSKISPDTDNCPLQLNLKFESGALHFQIETTENISNLPRHVMCNINLLDEEGEEKESKTGTHIFQSSGVWDFNSIEKSVLEKNGLIGKFGTLSLTCKISVSSGKDIVEFEIDDSNYFNYKLSDIYLEKISVVDLRQDFNTMLSCEKYTDVQLKVDDQTIQAHKCVLAARSPVFSAMFEQNMTEIETGIVDITDTDHKTLQMFLEFLYTGKTSELDYEAASKLMLVADKYQVETLKNVCSSFLVPLLSVEKVSGILILADMVGHQLLKEHAKDFCKRYSKVVLSSSEWDELCQKNCKLGSEILIEISK